ncbi:hypothetical protein CEXT_1611 [Caerostris extrusa]|uniref:Uncharacterized protein n=1 Tax=Caerostris extrusa TaxID=172846 RepID=A0AAV4XG66_CAEEX|nr:hypothetical protein CEXT_1611 [Caerostris extrusa]
MNSCVDVAVLPRMLPLKAAQECASLVSRTFILYWDGSTRNHSQTSTRMEIRPRLNSFFSCVTKCANDTKNFTKLAPFSSFATQSSYPAPTLWQKEGGGANLVSLAAHHCPADGPPATLLSRQAPEAPLATLLTCSRTWASQDWHLQNHAAPVTLKQT